MKLYTHEEIVNFLNKEFADEINAETFMENLTPIELPSDESLKDKLFNLADEFAFAGYGKTAVILHTIHNGLGNNEQEGGNK